MSASYIGKELNSMLLERGYAFNVPVDMDVRVISSYSNNNERLVSNTLRIKMTPYKVPPKVVLPSSGRLFLVGDASDGGWNNPVPLPGQEFSRLDETTFAGIFHLTGGKQYLMLPVNGDWTHKYAGPDTDDSGLSGPSPFKADAPNNFIGPAAGGTYTIDVNFQTGKFTVQ